MSKFKNKRKLGVVIAIGCVILLSIFITFSRVIPSEYDFEIHFIDVGHADAALVICEGQAMLIDGGNVGDSGLLYTYLKDRNIEHLDYVVASHAHEDHIGGLAGALNYATVDKVYCPVTSYDSKVFDNFTKYVERRNAEIDVPSVGETFTLGTAEVTILGVNASDDVNDTSIILRITYGDTSFLFTGDAERAAENTVINSGSTIESTVLKVGHHGSDSSTSYLFLREVMPKFAVISVGEDNEYGHPTEAVLSRLLDAGVTVYRTDIQGTIVCSSNGTDLKFKVYKNKDADTLHEVGGAGGSAETDIGIAETVPVEMLPATSDTNDTDIAETDTEVITYVLNTNSHVFHDSSCRYVKDIKEKNKKEFYGTREEAIELGYKSCGNCKP